MTLATKCAKVSAIRWPLQGGGGHAPCTRRPWQNPGRTQCSVPWRLRSEGSRGWGVPAVHLRRASRRVARRPPDPRASPRGVPGRPWRAASSPAGAAPGSLNITALRDETMRGQTGAVNLDACLKIAVIASTMTFATAAETTISANTVTGLAAIRTRVPAPSLAPPDAELVRQLRTHLTEDGSWPDVNAAGTSTTAWEPAEPLIGNKHFHRSDIKVHHRPGWCMSARMFSMRTLNTDNLAGCDEGHLSHSLAERMKEPSSSSRDEMPVRQPSCASSRNRSVAGFDVGMSGEDLQKPARGGSPGGGLDAEPRRPGARPKPAPAAVS